MFEKAKIKTNIDGCKTYETSDRVDKFCYIECDDLVKINWERHVFN
jgi:hypothetical protein